MKNIKNSLVGRLRGSLFEGLLPFDRSTLPAQLIAGIVLAAIAIPEVMGYTKIAGMPVITGIYTILLPIAIFAIFCSSRHLIVGADSATAAILFSMLVTIATPGSPKYVALASTAALLCAVFLMAARVFRLGFVGNFLSRTVLVGFLTGVGIQVALGQLSGMFGVSETGTGTITKLLSFFAHLPETSIITLIVSIAVVLAILVARRISKKIPGALIAVIGTIIASFIFDFSNMGIAVVGSVPGGLPSITIPTFYVSDLTTLLTVAMACFIVIIAQSAATSRAYATKCSEKLDENKDIMALALANGAAGLTGTFVVNGSPTKTQIAMDSGARSQLASLVTAAVVLVVLIFLTKPISLLPSATLASIVFLIGVEMVDIASLKDIYHDMPSEFILSLITVATVVFLGVLWGIILSVIISIILHLSHSYRPNNSILIRDKNGEWIFTPVTAGKYTEEGLIVYRFNRDLYYANSDRLMHEAIKLVKNADHPVHWFVLDSGGFSDIDYTSSQMLKELKGRFHNLNVVFAVTTVLPSLKKQFERSGLIEVIGAENIYENVNEAVKAFESQKND